MLAVFMVSVILLAAVTYFARINLKYADWIMVCCCCALVLFSCLLFMVPLIGLQAVLLAGAALHIFDRLHKNSGGCTFIRLGVHSKAARIGLHFVG